MDRVSIRRLSAATGDETEDVVAIEEPLEIRIEGKSIAVTMRTPGHDRELAAGFLVSEGVIRSHDDIFDIVQCPSDSTGNVLDVLLKNPSSVDLEKLTRHVFTSSSCGICGLASIERLAREFPPLECRVKISRQALFAMPEALAASQPIFQKTGGLHASALFDLAGRLVLLREDVGRHNALDKILGNGLLAGMLPFSSHVLLVSGRTSFEIVQKALAGGIGIIAAIGAPSSLAVDAAAANGQTLAGFLRPDRLNVYTNPERIL